MGMKAKKLIGGYKFTDIVQTTCKFFGRRTPPQLLTDTKPTLLEIPAGSQGIVHGLAKYVDGLLDVEFEIGSGQYVRVETDLGNIARV